MRYIAWGIETIPIRDHKAIPGQRYSSLKRSGGVACLPCVLRFTCIRPTLEFLLPFANFYRIYLYIS